MYINSYSTYNLKARTNFCSMTKTLKTPAVQKQLNQAVGKFDTENQVAKMLFELITKTKVSSQTSSKIKNSESIGKISSGLRELLNDICQLHKRLNTILMFMTDSEIYRLKKEYPNFRKFKPYTSITLNNINNSEFGLTFYNSLINKSIYSTKTICLHDKKNNVIDLIPIKGRRILQTQDCSKIKKTSNPLDYIFKDEFLSEDKVDLKKITNILNALKKELTNIFELTSDGGGIIDEKLGEDIINCESMISKIKKQIAIKKLRPKDFILYPNGAIEFMNINQDGDKLYWLPAKVNKKLPKTTIIKLLSSEDKLLDGVAINDERILSNYPTEHKDNFPQVMKFYTSDEVKKLSLDARLKQFIEYFDVGNQRFNKNLEEMVNFRIKMTKVF